MKKFFLITAISVMLFSGCGGSNPLSEDQMDYVGNWFAVQGNSRVTITAEGKGSLDYQSQGSSVSISSGNVDISDDELSIKFLFIGKTFEITQEPRQQNGSWVMELDGQQFMRR